MIIEPDRAAAIGLAIAAAGKGDIVLLAGKGHERGQYAGRGVTPFDDREVAADAAGRGAARRGDRDAARVRLRTAPARSRPDPAPRGTRAQTMAEDA